MEHIMDTIIGLKELRQNVAAYTEKVCRGQSFIVLKRSKPIFRITPIEEDEKWETILDFTKTKKGGVSAKKLLKYL